MNIKAQIKAYRITLLGIGIGAISGWLYWYFVGCQDGVCTIKSDPLNMTFYGALMGGLLFDMLRSYLKDKKARKN
jgi:hypothetical protein